MSILEAIRRDSSAAIWSRGVEIARSDKVIGESVNAEEVVLRVAIRPGTSPFMVNLWPGDEEWSCDCPSQSTRQ